MEIMPSVEPNSSVRNEENVTINKWVKLQDSGRGSDELWLAGASCTARPPGIARVQERSGTKRIQYPNDSCLSYNTNDRNYE